MTNGFSFHGNITFKKLLRSSKRKEKKKEEYNNVFPVCISVIIAELDAYVRCFNFVFL